MLRHWSLELPVPTMPMPSTWALKPLYRQTSVFTHFQPSKENHCAKNDASSVAAGVIVAVAVLLVPSCTVNSPMLETRFFT